MREIKRGIPSHIVAVALGILSTALLVGCSHVPRIDYGDNLVLGCPAPIGPNEPEKTLTDGPAVIAFAEALTLCDDELISAPEDRELQRKLQLQEKMERLQRKAKEKAAAESKAAAPASAPPTQ